MKVRQFLKRNQTFLILIASVTILSNQLRDPFEFGQETVAMVHPEPIKPTENPVNLGKWNIKEIGNDLLIMENDEGQIRTIQVSSFM